MPRLVLVLAGALSLALVLTVASSTRAQQRWVPPDPMNLQVLPKDIDKGQLVQTMRSFTQALGVRCPFCHVGEEGQPLDTFNFMSDAKEEKATARKMIRMVMDINDKYLKDVKVHDEAGEHAEAGEHQEEREAEGPMVTCYTCHRGEEHPLTRRPREGH
jgi:photosynthetic reaction center cytochrome c subunit